MTVRYGTTKDVDLFQLSKLLVETGCLEHTGNLETLANMVRGSTRIAWAIEDDALVGFASALTDGAFSGFVSHVATRVDCQGRGIEQALVDRLIKGQRGVTFVIRATPETAPHYAALGFSATSSLCYVRHG